MSISPPEQSSNSDHARWFAEEVQPHEPALRAYLSYRFPSLPDRDDLVQESYVRMLRARSSGKIQHAKAFLFSTARNAALDLFKRRPTVSLDALPSSSETLVFEGGPHAAEAISQKQELEILAQSVAALPVRCRQVMLLRYTEGLSHKEIADRLGISAETVKTHLVRGVDFCTDYFAKRGLLSALEPTP